MPSSHLSFRRHRRRAAAAVPLLLATVALAACGSDDEQTSAGGDVDLATVVPADAIVYGELLVRPEGDVEDGLFAAARRMLLVDDPKRELQRLIDEGLDEADRDILANEIDPALGTKVGLFVAMDSSDLDDPAAAVVIDVRDRDAAQRLVDRERGADARALSYEGVDYTLDPDDDTAYGFVEDHLVIGTERGFRAAAAAAGGRALADEERFTDAVDALPDDSIAWGYGEPRTFFELVVEQARAEAPGLDGAGIDEASIDEQVEQIERAFGDEPVTAAVSVREDQVAFEMTSGSAEVPESDGAVKLGELPGEAWAALAFPLEGSMIAEQLRTSGVYDMAAGEVRSLLGLDLDADLLGWIDGMGAFVGGTSLLDASVGLVLGSSDPDGSGRAIAGLERFMSRSGLPTTPTTGEGEGFQFRFPDFPQPLAVLAHGDKLAFGLGVASAREALDPSSPLSDTEPGKSAISSLGDGYEASFLLVPEPLLALVENLGVAAGEPEFEQVRRYVSAYRSIVADTKVDGDRASAKFVLNLQDPDTGETP